MKMFNYFNFNSLCNLSVLCASVVASIRATSTTETQRTRRLHRERPLLVGFLILLASVGVGKAQDTPADNWSQFRGNHQLTGVSLSPVSDSLKQMWTFEAGDSIESSAAIVGGTVFVGSQKGELVALNLDNGQ